MKRLPNATQRLMLALLAGIVAVPVSSTALFLREEVIQSGYSPAEIRERALEDRVRLRMQRRLYWDAIEQFTEKDMTKPDINDADSIEDTLAAPEVSGVRPSATMEAGTTLTSEALSTEDRLLLRTYTRASICPESLKSFRISGFYELCLSLVGSALKTEPVTGLLNEQAYMYRKLRRAASELPAFKLRQKMVEEANDSGNRRDPGVLPGRPSTCVMNPDCLHPRYSN